MSLERMFGLVEGLRETATADAIFGEVQEVEGRILIPVAAVGTGFGLGFGYGADEEAREEPRGPLGEEEGQECQGDWRGEGGGAGGGSGSRPVAVIEVTSEDTVIRPIIDEGKIALAGIALVAWIVFWLSTTVRAIFSEA